MQNVYKYLHSHVNGNIRRLAAGGVDDEVLSGKGLTQLSYILVTDTQASKIEGFVFMID